MSELNELYQELIIDHGRRPRNFHDMTNATCTHEGFNPLCGDRLTLYLREENGVVVDASFMGSGCAISMASASLMTDAVKGKTISAVHQLFDGFHHLVTGNNTAASAVELGKLAVFAGVAEYPMRVKCATLAWHTLIAAIRQEHKIACTELE